MKVRELSVTEVIGFNRKAIEDHRQRHPTSQERHNLIRRNDLVSMLASIFYQTQSGYLHQPVEKMAGLLLYRISQRQAFENGNKRTAVLATYFFLHNHGLKLRVRSDEVLDLINGFATPMDGSRPKYGEDDAIQFVFDNVMPKS